MRLYTAAQMRAADAAAVEAGVPSLVLMENAGREIAADLYRRWPGVRNVIVLCGRGNNGGDGYVAARHLREAGVGVRIIELDPSLEGAGADVRVARASAQAHGIECVPLGSDSPESILTANVLVDALLGSGLSRPLGGRLAELVDTINAAGRTVLSADVPTGVDADRARPPGPHLRATRTVQLAGPKVASALFPARESFGEITVVRIGIPSEILDCVSETDLVTCEDIRVHAPNPARDAHKYAVGTVLIVGGSKRYAGAVELAARGALRGGAGLVSTISEGKSPSGCPDIVRYPWNCAQTLASLTSAIEPVKAQVWVIGPGLDPDRGEEVPELLASGHVPTVLDAGSLVPGPALQDAVRRHGRCVMTPHAGEAGRLLGMSAADVAADPISAAEELANAYQALVVVKGASSVIAAPDGRRAVNTFGHPGMATGGTGDVLAGLIGAWQASAPDPFSRCCAAVGLHGLAGEAAARSFGLGLSASDLAAFIPAARADIA